MKLNELMEQLTKAGIEPETDILAIECQQNGDGKLHIVRLGRYVKLVELLGKQSETEARGCAS